MTAWLFAFPPRLWPRAPPDPVRGPGGAGGGAAAEEPPPEVRRELAANPRLPVHRPLAALPLLAQPEVLVLHDLADREAVVGLREVHVVDRDPRHLERVRGGAFQREPRGEALPG